MDPKHKNDKHRRSNAVCDGRGEAKGRKEVPAFTEHQASANARLLKDATDK
jgi:hypothetical protein